ncbi:hypothetical protein A2U01_0095523, partial [Trifolium medium]|nr:hypothetical protein [Trifolium medium]
MHDMKSEAL